MDVDTERNSPPPSNILGLVTFALTKLTKTLIAHGAGGGEWSDDTIQALRDECIHDFQTSGTTGPELDQQAAIRNSAQKMLELILDEAIRQAIENKISHLYSSPPMPPPQ